MSNTSTKNRSSNRPARRARRGATAPASGDPANANGEAVPVPATAIDDMPTSRMETVSRVDAPVAPQADQVAQLAFQYFAESGFVDGHALDHWLRAETELGRGS